MRQSAVCRDSFFRFNALDYSAAFVLWALTFSPAQTTGPGIPRVTFSGAEVGTRIYLWNNLVGRVVKGQMFQGYLMIFQDRGRRLSTFSLADPRNPQLVGNFNFATNGDEHVVPSAGTRLLVGGTLVNMANPAAPVAFGRFAPYFLSVWPAFQWPYLYNTRTYDANGASSPLTIINYSNPSAPTEVRSVDAISIVGFTTGTTHTVGNLLLVTSGDVYTGVSAWDIGNPLTPQLISVNRTGPGMYTSQLYGRHIVTTGPKNLGEVGYFNYSNPENIVLEWQQNIANMGDYAHFQNGHMYGSRLDGGRWIKYNLATRATVMTGTVPASTPAGRPFPTRYNMPMGNMLFMGDPDNDANGLGGESVGALFVHQARPDSIGPALLLADPPHGAVLQPRRSRIGLAFDEDVDNRLLDNAHIIIRPLGGAALPGEYGHNMGVVNFTPRDTLLPNTTYEVSIAAGAVCDWTGNCNAAPSTIRFSTGATVTGVIGQTSARATWRLRPRLGVVSRGAGLLVKLENWNGALPVSVELQVFSPEGRRLASRNVDARTLAGGYFWNSESLPIGPCILRVGLPGRTVSGMAWVRRGG